MTKTTKRLSLLLATMALGLVAFGAPNASASYSCFEDVLTDPEPGSQPGFGVAEGCFDGSVLDQLGDGYAQAGGHPHSIGTKIEFNREKLIEFIGIPVESAGPVEPPKNILVDAPPGLVGNPTVAEQCTMEDLVTLLNNAHTPLCSPESQVGVIVLTLPSFVGPAGFESTNVLPLYSIVPPTGSPARFGFNFQKVPVVLDAQLRSDGDYGFTVASRNVSEGINFIGIDITFWGTPASDVHDAARACPASFFPTAGGPTCDADLPAKPLLSMPTACTAPGEGLQTTLRTDSWFNPGAFDEESIVSHDPPGLAQGLAPGAWGPERGPEDCDAIRVKGSLSAVPTSIDTETPSGLEVHVEVPNPGLEVDGGIANSTIKEVKVALPQGVTINPSQAEGLGVCSPARYESTVLSFFPTPGKGCPDDSKVGSVSVKSPLLEETIPGDVYVAQQDDPTTSAKGAENPFDSLLAIYVVLREPQRGIMVKLAGKVDLEHPEHPGQIVTTFDDLPQLPFSSFDFKFREGARAPLVTPPTCGTYNTTAEFTGHSDPDNPIVSESSFQITRGIGGGPCPSGGTPSFNPGFSAGTLNNNAGSFSPTTMRLTRLDGEQNLTKFSATLPPGLLAKLAGVEKCSDAAIGAAQAEGRTGRQELASPSCPAGSQIGTTKAGAGVGSVLTYVPGKIYLAGPYRGAPLSIAAITPAVAGPFDVGTVVVRQALDLDPVTGVASVDGAASDPIPHILEGIPLKLRDLRVYVDRPDFTLNATGCDPSALGATLWGSFADVFSPADDVAVGREARYQAANCAGLGFKPALKINLKGGTKRGAHPALKAILTPRPGDANLARTVVKLPRSAFLDQAHIRTVCTRVQFAADACPKGAIYGKVTAWTPLLDEPLAGPAYLRSSDNKLPDLVFDLQGLVDIETSARIDSVKGGIRATFPSIPDAPLSRVIVEMQGGKKGLIVNSRNLCLATNRATVQLDGHNSKTNDFRPQVRAKCGKGRGTARR